VKKRTREQERSRKDEKELEQNLERKTIKTDRDQKKIEKSMDQNSQLLL
jgi:hypothetical protein